MDGGWLEKLEMEEDVQVSREPGAFVEWAKFYLQLQVK